MPPAVTRRVLSSVVCVLQGCDVVMKHPVTSVRLNPKVIAELRQVARNQSRLLKREVTWVELLEEAARDFLCFYWSGDAWPLPPSGNAEPPGA